jgi:hypothetical protein
MLLGAHARSSTATEHELVLDRAALGRRLLAGFLATLAVALPIALVGSGPVTGWLLAACIVGLWWMAFAWSVSIWWRRISPIIVCANAIELQASGPVPWDEIRAVVIDRRRVWLELNDRPGTTHPRPWLTAAHENLMGDGGGGDINVPVRWVAATPDEIATQIRRFAPVPIRMTVSTAADSH